MKFKLELNSLTDGRIFLNYWHHNGDDINCEIIDGKLMLIQYDNNVQELPSKEITINEFIKLIEDTKN